MKRTLSIFAFLLMSLLWAQAATPKPKSDSLLPDAFAGWQRTTSHPSANPADAEKVNPDLLKEYGFEGFEDATYIKTDRKMEVKAIRFHDATGAYGAFTNYRTTEMKTEQIGDKAVSANERVLFCRGNVLVQAVLDRVTPMSAAELRELAADISLPSGNARNLPTLPMYLPRAGGVLNSPKYVVGPAGLANLNSPVSASEISFDRGAELAQGLYNSSQGTATLTLISYPTPQIAGERLRAIEAAHAPPQEGSTSTAPLFLTKRSGPLVAIVTGAISPREAKSLLASVNYDAEVTWNERTGLSPRDNAGSLIVGVVLLTFIILGLALVAGIAFGGVRILLKRLFPDRIFDRSRDVEIIELKLH